MADYSGIFELAFRAHHYLIERETALIVMELKTAGLYAGLGAIAAGAIPVFAWGGVWAALGSGYAGARNEVSKEYMARGYSQGFIMGLLDWEWEHVKSRFGVQGVIRSNHFDARLDGVKTKAYAITLKVGFQVGKRLPEEQKKALLSGLRKHTKAERGNWTRNDQISYVIELSTVYRIKFMR